MTTGHRLQNVAS